MSITAREAANARSSATGQAHSSRFPFQALSSALLLLLGLGFLFRLGFLLRLRGRRVGADGRRTDGRSKAARGRHGRAACGLVLAESPGPAAADRAGEVLRRADEQAPVPGLRSH